MHLAATMVLVKEWYGEERKAYKACGIKSLNALLESLPLRLFRHPLRPLSTMADQSGNTLVRPGGKTARIAN